jgi:hypothetical protein
MLNQDQYFDQWWPTSQQYQSLQQYRSSKIFTGKGYRNPNAGEIASVEASLRNSARNDTRFGFNQAWEYFNTQQIGIQQAQQEQQRIQEIEAKARADAAALAAEQARLQEQLRVEQEQIAAAQKAEAAAIEAELVAERERITAAQKAESVALQTQLETERKQAETEQATLKGQFEAERVKTEALIGKQKEETARQQLITKRETATALNIGKQASTAKFRQDQAAATVRAPEPQRKKTTIGQPGVSSTRISARPSIGGYGGTAAGRVNPTGLNI